MKSLKSKIKNINGITLISLVITIIILIILAGVTLNMLLGENGIINRTKTARDENEKATATETMNLKITNVQISKYAEEQRMPTLKELADNFCEDDDFQYVQETSEVASLTKITNNSPTSIYTKLKAYPYEFEINSSLQLASIDGVKVATVPANDDDTIVSMTKAELKKMIQDEIAATSSTTSSTSNVYDTTKEQVVGTWIDGKPIYQKTITGLSLSLTWDGQYNTFSSFNFDSYISNKKDIIYSVGYIIDDANYVAVPVIYSSTSSGYKLKTYVGGTIKAVTVQYTKTDTNSTTE